MLPKELWTKEMHEIDCPVVRLEKALYGHKHSGVFWQQFCHERVKEAGFELISECWPCVYFNHKSNLMLVIYVDDMKMSGPAHEMEAAWKSLSKQIISEVPKGDTDAVIGEEPQMLTFLGCELKRGQRQIKEKTVNYVEYNISNQLKRALSKYEQAVYDATGKYPQYIGGKTPFIVEETKECPHRAPYNGERFLECPSCLHTIPESFLKNYMFDSGTQRKVQNIWPPC